MNPNRHPLLLLAAVLTALLVVSSPALADEITFMDPETCAESTVRVEEITSETWTEVKYREKARGPEVAVPTALVVNIKRDSGGGAQVRELQNAIGELRRGNLAEARRALKVLSGGGYKQNLESGKLEYQSFAQNDPPGRRSRPEWPSEYAHFFYAKSLFEEGMARDDEELLRHAYLALVDQPDPDGRKDEKGKALTTGGFLKRFEGGNSRWYADAMTLAARTLVGLKKYDEAAKMFKQLGDDAIAADIGPNWAYEAKLGTGRIAEAQGKYLEAINAYKDAASFMRLLLPRETRGCFRRVIGRLHSRARMQAAGIMLQRAEKNRSPSEFAELRDFINQSTPKALEQKYRTLPKTQRDALVEGALDPRVQAVMQNGLGLAYLQEGKFEDAILAFRAVEVKYFQVPEEHARALHYLARAADEAAKKASGEEARTLYQKYRDDARGRLKAEYPDSRWAQ